MPEEQEDQELAAIKTVLAALTPLKAEARGNVIEYVFRRLGITAPAGATSAQPAAPQAVQQSTPPAPAPNLQAPPPGAPTDLRSLTEQKKPTSANQMVAVLAYYLANLAPADQRRDHIVPDDIKKYFPQANFELPTGHHNMTLVNAKNAGYLDVIGAGQYRLNPVGHNLVTHKLPRGESTTLRGSRRAKKTTRKQAKKKTRT
jgi:hypothetical protein